MCVCVCVCLCVFVEFKIQLRLFGALASKFQQVLKIIPKFSFSLS